MPPPAERCENCKWWVRENGNGQCHKHAPAPLAISQGATKFQHEEAEVIYPRTPLYEWCGDYAKA